MKSNKKSNKHILFLLLLGLLMGFMGSAQKAIGEAPPEVKVLARATQNSIMLRFAVTAPTAWDYANGHGFVVERKTIARNGEILESPETLTLTPGPIKPKPMMEWENFTEESDNAAIAAQALFGDSFVVRAENGDNPLVNIINQAKALEDRFSFALFAADQDFKVARYSGLAFTDTSVVQGENYLYTVSTAIPTEILDVKPGGAYIGLMDFRPLPKPLGFTGVFKDGGVLLSWNYALLKQQYTNYTIERSLDGTTFEKLDNVPLAKMNDGGTGRMFYLDSLPENKTTYYYRLKGTSPFGETGPPSEVASGAGSKKLGYNPAIIGSVLSEDETSVQLTWEFPEEGLEELDHFELNRSDNAKNGYTLIKDHIPKDARGIGVDSLGGINYFTMTAVGKQGSQRVSFPEMVQLDDATPPAVPTGLGGTIDSTGVVQLQWQQNLEPDFLGYRVFRANLKGEEFTQVTFVPVATGVFTDTIQVDNLNPKVFYKVQAFDTRYNPSGFSETLTLQKPDIVPPTSPVFKSFSTVDGKVMLNWTPSSSEDAERTLVYRKGKGKEMPWELVADRPLPDSSHVDGPVRENKAYLYTLVTLDASGLESSPVAPLSIKVPYANPTGLDTFEAAVNVGAGQVELKWKPGKMDIGEYQLLRAKEGAPLTLYKVFKGDMASFNDTHIQVNTTYTYGIVGILKDGGKTPVQETTITY